MRSQVVNTSISAPIIDILHNWQNVFSPAPQNDVTVPRIEPIVLNDEQFFFINSILLNQELTPKLEHIEIRDCLRAPI